MSSPTAAEFAAELWVAATGKEPVGDDLDWKTFYDLLMKLVQETREGALMDAHRACYAYQPIEPQYMKPTYRVAYTTTVRSIGETILGLRRNA